MVYEPEAFKDINAEKKNKTSSQDWQLRWSMAKGMFPSLTNLDWAKVFKSDPTIMGELVNDIVKASESTPKRPGKRSSVSPETTRDNLLQLNGDDYSLEPFISTFKKITSGRSVRAIAAKTGLDRNQVHRLQTGKVLPDIYSMEVIATAYGKTGDYFVEYREYFIASTILDHLDNIPEAAVHFYRKLRKIGRHG